MKKKQNKINPIPSGIYRLVLLLMLLGFIFYNYKVYTSTCHIPIPPMSKQAIHGQDLWQKNNCTSCHQLYGLGGYLGPDLTNVVSCIGKGPVYIKSILNSGIKVMPKFNFSEKEKNDIVSFLSHVDSTGYFPNKQAQLQMTGWVNLNYKTTNESKNE